VNDWQIDFCYLVRLNSDAVSAEVGLSVAVFVVVTAAEAAEAISLRAFCNSCITLEAVNIVVVAAASPLLFITPAAA
jgi:hypothetical protein